MFRDFLLFDEKILESYGLYPHNHDSKKQDWLDSCPDKGKLYNSLHSKIVLSSEVNRLTDLVNDYESWFTRFFSSSLENHDYSSYQCVIEYLEQGKPVKTKLAKLEFDINMDKIFAISNSTGIPVGMYISVKFKLKKNYNILKYNEGLVEKYLDKVKEYTDTLDSLRLANAFVINKTRSLALRMEKYNSGDTEEFDKFRDCENSLAHKGKNWSQLTIDERKERFSSYICLQYKDNDGKFVKNLCKFVCESYDDKTLKYNQIKWNKRTGVVYDIKGVDTTSKDFSIVQASKKEVVLNFIDTNLGAVNEEMLYYILSTQNPTFEEMLNIVVVQFNILNPTYAQKKSLQKSFNVINELCQEGRDES